MTTNKRRRQKVGCYVLLVVFAIYLGYAGGRWVDGSITQVYPIAFSPDGKQFMSAHVVDGSNTIRRLRIRDAQGGSIFADLSEFEWIDGYRLQWSPDSTHIAGVARTPDRKDYRIVSVRVYPRVELAAEYPFDREGRLQGIDFNDQNELIAQHFCLNKKLEFRTDGKVTATFEVGQNESTFVEQTIGDFVQVRVIPEPSTDAAGNSVGEFLYTDGSQAANLLVDRRDGTASSKLLGNYSKIGGTSKYVLRRSTTNQGLEICDRSDPTKALIELPIAERPVFVIGQQAVTVNYPPQAVHVRDLETGQKRLIAESSELRSPTGPNPRPIFSDGTRKLVRLNLADGTITPLVDVTTSPIWKLSLVLGLPLLWALWIAVGVWLGSRFPFLDMIALCILTALVFVVWSMLFLREYRPDLGITAIGMVCITASVMLVLIWGSTAKTFWGTLLPSCVGSVSVVVLLIRIWSYNSSFRIVEGLVGATIGLGSQVVGLWMLRKLAGRITRSTFPAYGATARQKCRTGQRLRRLTAKRKCRCAKRSR